MIPAFPKIFHIGSPEIKNTLFVGPVEVTEKIDGSQIGFGKDDQGRLMIRSKGCPIYNDGNYSRQPDKLFKAAVDYIVGEAQYRFGNGESYYGEVISEHKHNTLTYGRIPKNYVLIYGAMDSGTIIDSHDTLTLAANRLGFDTVPLIFEGPISDIKTLDEWLNLDSALGATKVEGVVVKNYNQVADNKFSPYCFGKYVSERFKEANGANWSGIRKANSIDGFIESFKNDEARWIKAIQHFKEDGKYTGTLKDIGPLIDEIIKDMLEENAKAIKEKLYKLYERQFRGAAVAGFPEWYKAKLAKDSVINNEQSGTTSKDAEGNQTPPTVGASIVEEVSGQA